MNHLTYAQVAERLGVSVRTVSRMVFAQKIQVIDMGHRTKRIPEAALKRFVERRTLEATIV